MSPKLTATGSLDGIGSRNNSESREYRVFGPPGTGKTTALAGQVRQAAERYGGASVLVTSFSRAAACELVGRDLPLPPDRIGTLHSHCFRAVGEPRIAEANVAEWNRRNPYLAITPAKELRKLEDEDPMCDDTARVPEGDAALQELNRLRGSMRDRRHWPQDVRRFEQAWNKYKHDRGLFDFTDLIATCLEDVETAPGKPSVLLADEAQDLNPMQLRLIRKWGQHAEYSVIAGDDDQTIYSFTGARPDGMLEPDVPSDHKVILDQSHRMPAAVYKVSEALIRQVSRRQEKAYRPRPAAGAVRRLASGTYKSPEYVILSSAMRHLAQGRSIMFLASCSYMLQPVVQMLRKNGIPFHNPYRSANGFWNPLRINKRCSTAGRLASLLANTAATAPSPLWTNGDVALWSEWLCPQTVLRQGGRAQLNSLDQKQPATRDNLAEVLTPASLTSLLAALQLGPKALVNWWRRRLGSEFRDRAQFATDVAASHGRSALVDAPRVTVGTIHSVKGGQADIVYLFPDLSLAGDTAYLGIRTERDAIIRLFYVGMTRAREGLYLCERASPLAITFPSAGVLE